MNCINVKVDIVVIEGGTFDKTYQWLIGATPVAVDLTGYTAAMKIRSSLKSTTPLLSLVSVASAWSADGATGIYFPSETGEEGKYRIYLKDNSTQGMCASNKDIAGVYDLFLYTPAGEAVLKQYGDASILAAVTRT